MDQKNLQIIHDCLSNFKRGLFINKKYSICINLYMQASNLDDESIRFIDNWLFKQFKAWPECHVKKDGSKDIFFPVGGEEENRMSVRQENPWDNPRRLALLDFLIEQAKQQLSEMRKGVAMNKYTLQAIYKRLLEIKNKVNVVDDKICVNLYRIWYPARTKCSEKQDRPKPLFINEVQLNTWLYEQFEVWPECHVYEDGTKSIHYPVHDFSESDYRWITIDNRWRHKYHSPTLNNPKRQRLLDFLIIQAEQQLKEMDKSN